MRTTYSKFGVVSTKAAISKSGEIGSKAAQGRVDGISRGGVRKYLGSEFGAHPMCYGTNRWIWCIAPAVTKESYKAEATSVKVGL